MALRLPLLALAAALLLASAAAPAAAALDRLDSANELRDVAVAADLSTMASRDDLPPSSVVSGADI